MLFVHKLWYDVNVLLYDGIHKKCLSEKKERQEPCDISFVFIISHIYNNKL